MPEELPLEGDLIKVLAADTRREILGHLQDRRMTVTELSEELELGKATVHEHLNKLTDAGLVQRDEDDRLWVYYELTGRGKRLLNPQRTRFYLALASALVAALVAGLAVYGFMMTGGIGAGDETQQASQQLITPTADEVYADEAIEVPARLSGDGDVQAYLVDEESAGEIREGNLDVRGLPMRAYAPSSAEAGDVQARDETTLLRADASLQPGTYYLYVRGPEGDNAQQMPSVRLRGIDAEPDRRTWHQRLDPGPLEVRVHSEGQPLAGSLRLEHPDRGASPTVPLEDGRAEISARSLDAMDAGTYRLSVQPDDRERWLTTSTEITIRPAHLAVHPLHAPEGVPTPVHVDVGGPDRLLEQQPTVTPSHPIQADDDGWRIELTPEEPGSLAIDVARTSTTVSVHPSLALQATVHDGPEVHWNLTRLDGQPMAEAAVYLDGRAAGFTDANGTLVTDLPDEGSHRVTVHRADGATIARVLTVDGWRISQPRPSLGVDPVDVASTSHSAQITLEVRNDVPVAQPATIVAELAGSPAAAKAVTVPAEDSLRTELTVPVDLGRHQVTVRAQPLDPGPFTYANETTTEEEASDTNATDDGDAYAGDSGDTAADSQGGSSSTTVGTSTDGDGDGVLDADDACPQMPGAPANDGCPAEDAASKLEPIQPRTDGAAGAYDGEDAGDAEAAEGAESPAAGPLVAAALLAAAALLGARARKP